VLDILAGKGDDFARQKLTEGLRGIGEALVSPAVALGLLARDDHASVRDIAHRFLEGNHDAHTKAQAVRLLGSDPAETLTLLRLMQDKSEFREVRRASAVALRALDPDAFVRNARSILADHSDFQDIRKTVSGALARAGLLPESDAGNTSSNNNTSSTGGGSQAAGGAAPDVVRSGFSWLSRVVRLFGPRVKTPEQ
jgi:hypothetical protein